MALKIRLRQQGRNNRPFYRLVLADVHAKRDGKFIEQLGWYNPFAKTDDQIMTLNAERIRHWIAQGAEVSECARALIVKAAPEVAKFQIEKVVAKRAQACAKKKERKARAQIAAK